MEQIGKLIGKRKYEALKALDLENITDDTMTAFNLQFKDITVAEGIKMISAYEEKYKPIDSKVFQENVSKTFDRIYSEKPKQEVKYITKEMLWKVFVKRFTEMNGKGYSNNFDSLENIKAIIYYFIGDFENLKKCSIVSLESKPSLRKGLLIIGGYGNGKTSIMRTLESVLKGSSISFRMFTSNEVVDMFEACQSSRDKDEFWKIMKSGTICFDDVLTEREASNYGKVNLFKDILEKRYDLGKRTYLTLNYKDGTNNDLNEGLRQLGEKYGSRVYDRIFSMFNILEFKGKSFRK